MRPVFVSGCGRSGTTLLGAMLGTHSRCLATPESKFVVRVYRSCLREDGEIDLDDAWYKIVNHWSYKIWGIDDIPKPRLSSNAINSYADMILSIVKEYGEKVGNSEAAVWIDHTPYARNFAKTLFNLFPDGKMIHLVRDGRAVASSVMKLDWGPNTVNNAAHWWIEKVANGLAVESFFGEDRVLRVRYEDLIRKPEFELRKISDFIEIDYEKDMINASGFRLPDYTAKQHSLVGGGLDLGRLRAWENELTPRQIEIFEDLAGNMLECLGYHLMFGLSAKPTNTWEKITLQLKESYYRFLINKVHRQRRIRRATSESPKKKTYTIVPSPPLKN
jgi:hypothetical protein